MAVMRETLEAFGTPEFEAAFSGEVSLLRIDTDEIIQGHGWSEVDEIRVVSVDNEPNEILVHCAIDFTEYTPSGCSDITHEECRIASLLVRINKQDARAEYEVEQDYSAPNGDYA